MAAPLGLYNIVVDNISRIWDVPFGISFPTRPMDPIVQDFYTVYIRVRRPGREVNKSSTIFEVMNEHSYISIHSPSPCMPFMPSITLRRIMKSKIGVRFKSNNILSFF